ncbi:MAG: hypothetical protein ACOYW4_09440 [Bacillota bacterium]
MSVRSVDVQNAIARTQEAERVQRVQNDVARTGQQAFAAEFSRRAEERSHQVTSSPRPEGDKIRDEKERRGRGSQDAPEGKAQGTPGRATGQAGTSEEAARTQQGGESRAEETLVSGRVIDVEV